MTKALPPVLVPRAKKYSEVRGYLNRFHSASHLISDIEKYVNLILQNILVFLKFYQRVRDVDIKRLAFDQRLQ